MTSFVNGRWTAKLDEPHVVFLIGMRINRWWKPHKWMPIIGAMGGMISELHRQPELGFLGADTWVGRTILMVQYWRSFEALESYAHARDNAHLPAWTAFNRAVGSDGDVGIFHETYRVSPGDYEVMYVNMPRMLFGRVAEPIEATGQRAKARGRMMGAKAESDAPEPVAANRATG